MKYWNKTVDKMPTFIFITGLLLKFLLFDVIWCLYTTFTPFSFAETYLTKIIAVMILSIPYFFFRQWKLQAVIFFLLDALMIANLMYYRTYYTAIPLSSYTLAGNLADFTQSVYDSIRWYDVLFPLSSMATILLFLRRRKKEKLEMTPASSARIARKPYFILLFASCIVLAGLITLKGGFRQCYISLKCSAHLFASDVPMYTLFGNLCHELIEQQPKYSAEKRTEINDWLAQRPPLRPLPIEAGQRSNCIVILVESLESWVLETSVENMEVTPYLNKLLKDSTTLYAPHVLTQVKGGRSIDAQLLLCAGLLPISSGTYSSPYTGDCYYTLQKALKEKHNTRNYLLTVDKKKTWNQEAVALSFGIDTIISYPDFKLTEAFGPRKRVGDGSFFVQCREKMENGEVWKEGENVYMQLVTYSGHNPFHMPDDLKRITFSENLPKIMNDYMTVVNYTDHAIGKFVEYLKSRPEYKETLIVITGDHEGLAWYRSEVCNHPQGKGIVSDKQFTPFIVLNSPVGMRYEKVMGQIDMYPTLLNLLQLEDYCWSGLGQSILDPGKKGFAVSPQMQVEGEEADAREVEFRKDAYRISDEIIRFDYFEREKKQ